ncbi:AI-2E family transporter [Marinobacter sp. M1N3S26]|uniref:AI-2E family transporter n=1 Tax=unclassified Marinobacter TaxID=83889 RepID=UPI00387B58A9
MAFDESVVRRMVTRDLLETLIRVALVLVLAVVCVRIVTPFANLVIWATILAIALSPMTEGLAARLGSRRGLAAGIVVISGLLLIGVPTLLLGISFVDHLAGVLDGVRSGALHIDPPPETVADWPLIGNAVYGAWSEAAANLPQYAEDHREALADWSRRALSGVAGSAVGILLFLASIAIAGVMLAYASHADQAFERIFVRFTDPVRGRRLKVLSIATVRSVATGVIGVAFIQSLLLGVGFLLAGIPAAGVLALVVFLTGIIQLPALIITLPAIAYLWTGDGSTVSNTVFTVYLFVAGLSDNVLKPLLLGRGVEAPMIIVLLGALGGMITGGLIGLFVGGVVLAVGYQIFMEWVDAAEPVTEEAATDVRTSAEGND